MDNEALFSEENKSELLFKYVTTPADGDIMVIDQETREPLYLSPVSFEDAHNMINNGEMPVIVLRNSRLGNLYLKKNGDG